MIEKQKKDLMEISTCFCCLNYFITCMIKNIFNYQYCRYSYFISYKCFNLNNGQCMSVNISTSFRVDKILMLLLIKHITLHDFFEDIISLSVSNFALTRPYLTIIFGCVFLIWTMFHLMLIERFGCISLKYFHIFPISDRFCTQVKFAIAIEQLIWYVNTNQQHSLRSFDWRKVPYHVYNMANQIQHI